MGPGPDGDMPPDMRERRSMGPGPDGDMPPDMRERRSMGPGPDGDMPPDMRERRPMGPEGDMPPHMRERRPMGPPGPEGERRLRGPPPDRTPQMGERRPRGPSDPNLRMSRSCSPSPNRRRPRPPPQNPNGDVNSPHLSFRNSPRSNVMPQHEMSPSKKPIDMLNSSNSSLGRDPTGMNMHKPMNSPMNMNSPFRSPRITANSPISPMILPEGRHNSLNREMGHSTNSSINSMDKHRRNASVSSSISAHSTSSDRPPKSIYRKSGLQSPSHHSSGIIETSKTPLIVNNVGELNAHSAEIQTVNEFGEVENVKEENTNQIEEKQVPQAIDFNQLLDSLDTTLQNKPSKFTGRSVASTPSGSRRNSELEKMIVDRKSQFEDMEKLLDTTLQQSKIKSRANVTSPVKAVRHESKHYDNSHLQNLLEQLSMTTSALEKESRSESASSVQSNSNPNININSNSNNNLNTNVDSEVNENQNLDESENTIKELQEKLDSLAIQTKKVLLWE